LGRGISYPRPHDVLGPAVAQKYKNTSECTILEKIQKFFPCRGPTTIFLGGGGCENVSPSPTVALDRPGTDMLT